MSVNGSRRGDGVFKGAICELREPIYGDRRKPVIVRCECGRRIRNSRNTLCTRCIETQTN